MKSQRKQLLPTIDKVLHMCNFSICTLLPADGYFIGGPKHVA